MRPYFEVETDLVRVLQRDLPIRVQVALWRVTAREESTIGRTRSEVTRELITSWSLVPTEPRTPWAVYSWRDGVVLSVEGDSEAAARAEELLVDEPSHRHEAMPRSVAERLANAHAHGRATVTLGPVSGAVEGAGVKHSSSCGVLRCRACDAEEDAATPVAGHEQEVRADERERLANEAYVRGDIGKDGPDVWEWLLSESAATANPKRWLTFAARTPGVTP
jgi:hypothetical protein